MQGSDGVSWRVTVCGALQGGGEGGEGGCGDGVPICQADSHGVHHSCGSLGSQQLRYFEGSLTMAYTGGDKCNHVSVERSSEISFECDRSNYTGAPAFVSEVDCVYTFVWPTALACPPRELECVVAGGKYDLRPLLDSRNWLVSKAEGVGGDYQYVIGGCSSIDFKELPKCPQIPGVGACRYHSDKQGTALGYVTGDLNEESEGVLHLDYHNGEQCASGQSSLVHVQFICAKGKGLVRKFKCSVCVLSLSLSLLCLCANDDNAFSRGLLYWLECWRSPVKLRSNGRQSTLVPRMRPAAPSPGRSPTPRQGRSLISRLSRTS